MVSCDIQRVFQALKDAFVCVLDGMHFAMDRLFRLHDFRAEQLCNRLVTQADTQNRDRSCEMSDDSQTDARFIWCLRNRRNQDHQRIQCRYLFDCYFIVPFHHNSLIQLPQILDEVVGEGIIIIYYKYHTVPHHHCYFFYRSFCQIS